MSSDRLSNTIIVISIAVIAIGLFVFWFITPSADLPRVPRGLRSGQEEAFQGLIGVHPHGRTRTDDRFLIISAFSHPGVAHQYFVQDSGEEQDAQEVWNWARQGLSVRQMTPKDMVELRQAASHLPNSDSDPAVEHLVVVSFWQGTRWLTRSYDSQELPAELTTILEIIHRGENRLLEGFEKWLNEHPPATKPCSQ